MTTDPTTPAPASETPATPEASAAAAEPAKPAAQEAPAPVVDTTAALNRPITPPDPAHELRRLQAHGPRTLGELRELRLLTLAGLLPILGRDRGRLRDLLAGFDVGALRGLLDAIAALGSIEEPLDSPAGVKAHAIGALEVAKAFVLITPGDRDDQIVLTVERVLETPHLLDLVSELAAGLLRQPVPAGAIIICSVGDVENILHGQQVATIEKAALDPATIVNLVQLIVTIWRAFRRSGS